MSSVWAHLKTVWGWSSQKQDGVGCALRRRSSRHESDLFGLLCPSCLLVLALPLQRVPTTSRYATCGALRPACDPPVARRGLNGRVATRTRQGAGHLFGTHDASSASLRSTAQREITSSVRRRVHRIPRAPAQPCGPEKLLRSHCRNGIHHLPHAIVPGRPASPRRVERAGISVITEMLARSTQELSLPTSSGTAMS